MSVVAGLLGTGGRLGVDGAAQCPPAAEHCVGKGCLDELPALACGDVLDGLGNNCFTERVDHGEPATLPGNDRGLFSGGHNTVAHAEARQTAAHTNRKLWRKPQCGAICRLGTLTNHLG